MKRIALHTGPALALLIAGMLSSGPALADKPSFAGEGKGGKHQQADRRDSQKEPERGRDNRPSRDRGAPSERGGGHFSDQHRKFAHDYYSEQFRTGRCPPGLAKKHNGCMPPGQARKWTVGQPLPRYVIYYEVPPALVVQFGQPPARHRYVRVASDILLIALGTGMVVDALQDLGRQ